MPQKTGPATAQKETAETADAPSTEEALSEAPEEKETAEESAPEQAPRSNEITRATDEQRKAAAKLYPEGTDLWFGTIEGLVFAFPRIINITPKRQWLRQIYNLTELAQTFEWLALAKVSQEFQDLTDLLNDEQYMSVFNAWFTDAEVSLPK